MIVFPLASLPRMRIRLLVFPLALLLAASSFAASERIAANERFMAGVQQRWETSPHGPWLARILPPAMTPARLPRPESHGAQLAVRYCVQCHHLPNPAMHGADKWPRIVDRMVFRMRGQGNMGKLMRDMMADVKAPDEEEIHILNQYLRRNAQKRLDPRRYPDLATRGRSFNMACAQCHDLPDPKSHTAGEWREVVSRMERNMAWMNRVVGSRSEPYEPQLRVAEILAYLERYAARN